jgi:hypothetical protein
VFGAGATVRAYSAVKRIPMALVFARAIALAGISCGAVFADLPPNMEELVALLQHRDKELRAFAGIYFEIPPEGIHRNVSGGYLRRAVAFRKPRCFFRDNSHGHSSLAWQFDPFRDTLLITEGEAVRFENLPRQQNSWVDFGSGRAPSV